jgi:RNA polymerase sigma factor (sigma-70 family)
MRDTQQLLMEYVDTGSESAFRELVGQYIDLVYSTARRLVGGDAHLAQDVAQTVFLHLSRNARKLSRESMLGGWLHRDTCFVASKTLRSERRRRAREREAVFMNSLSDHSEGNLEELAPILDEAINLLASEDRTAILLRFFEQRDFRAVGMALGSNEDAARMRVNRALEKLQVMLRRRGVALSVAGLASVLGVQAVTAAPAGLAGNVAGAVLAGTAAASALSGTLVKTIVMTKIKAGIIGTVVIAGVVASLVFQHQAAAKQRVWAERLRQQAEQIAQVAADNERWVKVAVQASNAAADEVELGKLRAEAAALREQTNGLQELRQENRRLQAVNAQVKTPLQQKEELMAKMTFAKDWVFALVLYSEEHGGQFPTNFNQAASFLRGNAKSETNLTTAQFEILYQGKRDALADPGETIVLREKQPWIGPDGKWLKVYAFGDGHSQLHSEPEGQFDAYEKAHLAPGATAGQ